MYNIFVAKFSLMFPINVYQKIVRSDSIVSDDAAVTLGNSCSISWACSTLIASLSPREALMYVVQPSLPVLLNIVSSNIAHLEHNFNEKEVPEQTLQLLLVNISFLLYVIELTPYQVNICMSV